MKYEAPFSMIDKAREKASTRCSEMVVYQADPELRAELTERMLKKREEMIKERERGYALSGSSGNKKYR